MLGQFSGRVLLTGAGWTKNWNGLLARDVWHHLTSAPVVQKNANLRSALLGLSSLNFEEGYELVMSDSKFTAKDRSELDAAIVDVFRLIDDGVRAIPSPVNDYKVNELINYLVRKGGEQVNTAYVFTLNQDLFFERKYIQHIVQQVPSPNLPSIPMPPLSNFFTSNMAPFNQSHVVNLGAFTQSPLVGRTNIIKLHGSFNWRSAGAAFNEMVIGTNKTSRIAGSKLLSWYLDIFKAVLNQGGVRLLIVGYGFGDEHINDAIADAVKDNGLQIYFWNTTYNLRTLLAGRHRGLEIWNGHMGSLPDAVDGVFPPDQSVTPACRSLFYNFLGVRLP